MYSIGDQPPKNNHYIDIVYDIVYIFTRNVMRSASNMMCLMSMLIP